MGYLSQDDIHSVAHSLSKCIRHLTRACHHWCTLFLYGALHIRPDNDDGSYDCAYAPYQDVALYAD